MQDIDFYSRLRLPPSPKKPDGKWRRVGFELEFAGLGPLKAARIITELYGGRIEEESVFVLSIADTAFGDFRIEIDASLLKEKRYENFLHSVGVDIGRWDKKRSLEEFILKFAQEFVPCEIVAPPIPLNRIPEMDRLRAELYRARARGTRESIFYAFGLHLNIEPVELTRDSILSVLRAFILVEPAIRSKSKTDVVRMLTPYIDNYPADYMRMVVDADYDPPLLSDLARDYMLYNPSRNRSLDMMPLFAYLEPEMLSGFDTRDKLVKPRPAYHYRLPNSSVSEPDWSLLYDWNIWVRVEELAADSELLAEFSREFIRLAGFPHNIFNNWRKRILAWLAQGRA
ncbi:MAG: amidoligase family protein [Desulfonatronovibrionaceae bacterium]